MIFLPMEAGWQQGEQELSGIGKKVINVWGKPSAKHLIKQNHPSHPVERVFMRY
jgi:hypothetical protein